MSTLYLHIGQGKTGTTWIQASLRLSRKALGERHGIDYPRRNEPYGDDAARITSGNGKGLLRGEAALAEALASHRPLCGRDCFFSSEFLEKEIREIPDINFLPRIAQAAGFSCVRVLLFIRDPIGQAMSGVQQRVKREGSTESVEGSFRRFEGPADADASIARLEGLDGVTVTIRNYSRCKDRLLEETAAWLGLPEDALERPQFGRINRSLTAGELALQRELNAVLGISGRLLADPLCERLPDIESDEICPSLEVQEEAWTRLLPAIERVNARLPEEHRYRRDLREPTTPLDSFCFSEVQLRVIAEGLGAEVKRQRADSIYVASGLVLLRALLRRVKRRLRGRSITFER